ncbi:CoA transferase [Nocardioides sp. CBS4Y-1]|uniref:CoA transferase n=1 Tax=Nocardioides acrostichi TaxID=2784339 RepID=A0A930V050_9ACTN|nr:CoA transferase [Nocardioides acrostichi]
MAGSGPLSGLRVVELGSIGPGPFCAMLLADLGAEVVRVDRADDNPLIGPNDDHTRELMHRGRRSLALDLKDPGGRDVLLTLCESADVLLEGYRPGVCERLGLGPDDVRERAPHLVYARATGWGQSGADAMTAGHDINYLAITGVLGLLGQEGSPPRPPLSLLGDFGGGGLVLAFGIVAALFERQRSGLGQVVDGAMVDGAATLATPFLGYWQTQDWSPLRGSNITDGGAPYYDVYETSDGRWLSLGALEPRFYREMLEVLGLDEAELPEQTDRSGWPVLRTAFSDAVASLPLKEWVRRAAGRDACIAPVLTYDEVEQHPHLRSRGTYVRRNGMLQPAPVPRFARTPGRLGLPPPVPGTHSEAVLHDWGVPDERVRDLVRRGVVQARKREDPPA